MYYSITQRVMMKKNQFLDIDIEKNMLQAWCAISLCSKKAFFYMFAIINIVFLWHTVTFFFGDHDWWQIKSNINLGWSIFDGRWGAGLLQQYAGGDILPVLNNLFCFSGFCLAMITLAKYWKIPKTVFTYTTFGLFIMLMPYTYPWLQFVRSETHFWNIFIVIIGLMLANLKKIYWQIAAILLFTFSMGCYGALLGCIISIYLCKCLLDVWFEYTDFKNFIKDHYRPAICIIISSILFVIISYILREKYHMIESIYTTKEANIEGIWKNILDIPKALKATFFAPLPFIPSFFKVFLLMGFPLSIFLLLKKGIKEILLIMLLIISLALTTQLINIVSETVFYNQLRLDFFWMPYIYAVGWSVLLKQKRKFFKSLALIAMVIATYYSALQAFRCQKVQYFDKQSEMKVWDDVRSRIKANPKFSPDKKYYLYVVGAIYEYRQYSIFYRYNELELDLWNSWVPFVPTWQGNVFLNFYETKPYVIDVYNEICNLVLTDEHLKKMDLDYLMNKAEPWPSMNSIKVDDKMIYVILSQSGLDRVRQRIVHLQY